MSALGSPHEDEGDVDREIRIEEMKRKLEELSSESMISGSFGDVSPELGEIFLERVCELEKAPWGTNFDRLVRQGIELIPPAELDDAHLRAKLDEVVRALAAIACFLHDTDHLSDREVYTWLWSDALREETPELSQLGGAWHTSPIGSGTDEDIAIFLKYYASEKERAVGRQIFRMIPCRHILRCLTTGIGVCRGHNNKRDFARCWSEQRG